MGIVRARISTSLDGYVAGPNPSTDEPLGEGGERLRLFQDVGAARLEQLRAVEAPGVSHLKYRVSKNVP